jgi:hypothetical protein
MMLLKFGHIHKKNRRRISLVKGSDRLSTNTIVLCGMERKPWTNFENNKQFKSKYLQRKNMLSKLYRGFKLYFKIILIRTETFIDYL